MLGFIKDKLPGPIAGQIDKLIGGGDESGGGMMDKLGSMFGKRQLNRPHYNRMLVRRGGRLPRRLRLVGWALEDLNF